MTTQSDEAAAAAIASAKAAGSTAAAAIAAGLSTAIQGADAPLGKPAGTVRAYLALGIVGTFLAGSVATAVALAIHGDTAGAKDAMAAVGTLALTATTVYFGTRTPASGS